MNEKLISELKAIPGIGEKKAKELISEGVISVDDLKKEKYFDDLPIDAKLEIRYKPCRDIPRNIVDNLVNNYLPKDWIPVGSYRRGQKILHDLDFLSMSDLKYTKDMLNIIATIGKKIEILYNPESHKHHNEEKRISFVLKLNFEKSSCNVIKIDIFRTTKEDLPYALFHYTGSKNFNIRTRAHAKRLGYILNQYGLFKNGKKIHTNKIKTEKDLFNILGVTYKTPEERNE